MSNIFPVRRSIALSCPRVLLAVEKYDGWEGKINFVLEQRIL